MPVYRGTIVVCIQHLQEDYDSLVPGSNGACYGSTFGQMLPGYDGHDRLNHVDARRALYASALPLTTNEVATSNGATDSRQYMAPEFWWQGQLFEQDVVAAPSFVVAWGAKVNMGTGYDVQ